MSFKLANRIEIRDKYSNVDQLWGPYESIEAACEAISESRRERGLTVGIISNDNLEEYWWKLGTSDSDLQKKVEEYELEIDSISHVTNVDLNEITFDIKVDGRGFGVQTIIYLGSNRLTTVATLLNQNQTITIKAPENPGNYTYTISVVDSILGNGTQQNYEVIWKEVDVKINPASPIFTYKVKSLQNIINSSFSFEIYKIDTLQIDKVAIVYGNEEFILYQSGDTYTSTYQVDMINLNNLNAGDLIQVKITGENLLNDFYKDIIQLTAPGIFSQCQGTIPPVAYNGLSFSATFRFEAENEGSYQVVIKDGNNIVYNSSLASYNTNILTIKLTDNNLSPSNLSSTHILNVFIDNQQESSYTFSPITLKYVSQTEKLDNIDENTLFLDSFNFNLSQGQTLTLQSFILDIQCYIPYTEEREIQFKFGGITIDRDNIMFGHIVYPTPIQQDLSLGFIRNIKTSYQNNDYYYDALFINGVLCSKYPYSNSSESRANIPIVKDTVFTDNISNKIRLYYNTNNAITESPEHFIVESNYKARNPELQDSSDVPVFRIQPLMDVYTKANLTSEQIESIVNGELFIDGTTYTIIDTNNYKIGNFGQLGDTKYNLDELINDFCIAYNVPNQSIQGESEDERSSRILETLKKKVKKDPSKIPNNYCILTKQIVKSKSLLQKYVAVPCSWTYGNNEGYLLAFTQGTSTLEYALPNFTFKFYNDKKFSEKATVSLVPKINRSLINILNYSNETDEHTEYYEESELVAKADYMESSHLNNTPTAMFYNAITSQQTGYSVTNEAGEVVERDGQEVKILQNPTINKLNAIEGIPIVLDINSINYGSFMLNIGKTGKSIGFGNNGISLEGTSNDDSSGMSSRFGFSENDLEVKNYIDNIQDINQVTEVNEKFAKFLAGGLEYRYSKKDLSDIGENEGTEENPDYSEYLRILKMWYWVYTHETYTRQQFEEVFNFDFAALYYIQMMIFGQTDNLGKNCMFDQFDSNGQWYVRPYDMDSQAGINNNGSDILSPVIEISDQFVLDLGTKDQTLIDYLTQSTPRFPYSSKTSNLWIRFYRNLKPEIEIFYGYLRRLGYSAEAVIRLCQVELIDKLKITQYNIDFQNKYLTNLISSQQFAYGNRWIRFKDWIQKRFDFCDTYFGYNKYQANTTASGITYNIKYSLPQYTIYVYNNQGGEQLVTNWGTECSLQFQSTTKQTMTFSPKYIIDDDGIFLTGFSDLSPKVKLNNLTSYTGNWNNLCNVVDLSENSYLQYMSVDNINSQGSGVIPNSVKYLTINNSTAIPRLENYNNLEELTLSNCEGEIYLENCPNLKRFIITSGKQLDLTLINCGNENSYINLTNSSTTFRKITLNGAYINYLNLQGLSLDLQFVNNDSYIKMLNLQDSTILNKVLDINNLNTNILILHNISEVKVVTRTPKSYSYLGLYKAPITQWGNTEDTFDGSYFSNLSNIKIIPDPDNLTNTIMSQLANGTYTGGYTFRLRTCHKIKKVVNLNITTGDRLFSGCSSLESIKNSIITASGQFMFNCCYKLNTLPTDSNLNSTITISGTTGEGMFQECHKLSYTDIEKVLQHNLETKYWNANTEQYQTNSIQGVNATQACKITNYTDFMRVKTYFEDTNINLNLYAFATLMPSCFCITAYGNEDTSFSNKLKVTVTFSGTLSKSLTNAQRLFSSNVNHKIIVPDNVMQDCLKLTNLTYCFANNLYSWTESNQTNYYYFKVPVLPNNVGQSLGRLCYNSRVDVTNLRDNNDGKIYIPSNTAWGYNIFYGATFEHSEEVSQIFSKCTDLVNVTNCFRGCNNFTCSDPVRFTANGDTPVNIAGIFASTNASIPYGFIGNWYSQIYNDSAAGGDPTYVTGSYSTSTTPASQKIGPYYNCSVIINDEAISINNALYPMEAIFHGATLNSTYPKIQLEITTYDCRAICKNTDGVNIEINSLNGIKYANEAFYGASKLTDSNKTISLPNTLINAQSMFRETPIINLPEGLKDCTQLNDISYMFTSCTFLGQNGSMLSEDEFFLPISVKNIDYLFYNCQKLHGGIPEKFIEFQEQYDEDTQTTNIIRNTIKNLVQTFSQTNVLKGVRGDYPPLNISQMFPEATNVTGLFYGCSNAFSGTQSLTSDCFSKCITCNDLFNSASVTLPEGFSLPSATSLRFAFASGMNDTRSIANLSIINRDADITGLFAAYSLHNLNSEVNNNLQSLLLLKDQTRKSYTGMLYGYNEDTTLYEYRYAAATSSRPIKISRVY